MTQTPRGPRAVHVLALCLAAAILLIPLRIIGTGYLPNDDALRHAAKAVSGRDWGEILVLRPGITMDSHPGWHAVLGALHRATGAGVDALVVFSVVSLFALFALLPLAFARRAESWLLALLVVCATSPILIQRLLLGRPYLLTMALLMAVLFSWRRLASPSPPRGAVAAAALCVAVSTWVHGLWYLWALPLACLLAARQWRAARRFGAAAACGVLAGAALTLRPLAFLAETSAHLFRSLGEHQLARMLVNELQPMTVEPVLPLAVLGFLAWRRSVSPPGPRPLADPVFLLAAAGWVLGLAVSRFWWDWGVPALLVWLTVQIDEEATSRVAESAPGRLAAAGAAAATLVLLVTADVKDRWTGEAHLEPLALENPEHAPWLPEPGGVLYANNMSVFYRTFARNPDAPWRYLLGFEPGMMPAEDLATFRSIQWNFNDPRAFAPWVRKMTPRDRLVLLSAGAQPAVPGLEWRYAATMHWVGRLPRR